MMYEPEDPRGEDRERRLVRHKVRSLRYHLITYAAVIAGLFVIDIFSGGGFWVQWPALGWGVGLAMHAASVFGMEVGEKWEDRMVDRIMSRRAAERPPGRPPVSPVTAPAQPVTQPSPQLQAGPGTESGPTA